MRTQFGLVAILLLWASLADASHFRGAFYRWIRKPTPSAPFQVQFTVTSAWAAAQNGTGFWAFSSPNDNIYLEFGDGVQSSAIQGSQILESSDVTGEYIIVRQTVLHTYAASGVYKATWNSFTPTANYGARKLLPNTKAIPGSAFGAVANLTTSVDLTSGFDSPIAQIPLVLELPISRPGFFATYALPIADPSGLEHICRMATFLESGINYLANVSSAGHSTTIAVTPDCVISWDTSPGQVGQAWAVQVVLEQVGSQTTIPLDFIVTLVNGSNTPTCVSSANTTVIITAGSSYTFFFTGTTPNTSYSTLRLDQLASDAGVFSPALPINGSLITSTFNVSFTATPAPSLTAELMTLTITDGLGYQAYCSASFQGIKPHPAPFCNTSVTGTQSIQVGSSKTFTVTAGSNADTVSSLLITADVTTYATIQNLGHNVTTPISSSVTVAPTAPGTETINFQFTDFLNLVADCPVSFQFYAPPTTVFEFGGNVITSITIPLGTAATVTIVGTSPDTFAVTLVPIITGVPSWGVDSPLASYTSTAGIPLALTPTTTSVGTFVNATFTDSFGLSSSAILDIIVVANPPTCGYPSGTSIAALVGNTTVVTITGSTTDTVSTTLTASVTTSPTFATYTISGGTVTFTLHPTTTATGSLNVTYTDYLGQFVSCSVDYSITRVGCAPGTFDVGGTCQPQYLITAFGETPYGAMGVGATGNAAGSVPYPTIVEALSNENVEKIQTGPRHSSLVTNVGNLYVAGLNGNGQLGINSTSNQDKFVLVHWFTNNSLQIVQAFPGGYHTLVLTSTNVVYGFGLNSNGQLGQGTGSATSYKLPVVVTVPSGTPRGVATGFQHSLIWTDTQVYAFGSGDHGQSGANHDVYVPTLVFTAPGGVTVTTATCGGYSSSFLLSTGDAYGYGGNIYGTLGIGTYSNTATPTHVSTLAGNVAFLSQAEKHAIFILKDGTLWATGNNACGNLGLGNFVNHDTPAHITFFDSFTVNGVATGWTHSLVWTTQTLYVFGCDDEFNLGIPQVGSSPYPTPTPITNNYYNSSNVVIGADCKGHYSLVLSQLF
jgi:alpha-tubulin suppressor-like RCC1 family protein